MSYIFCPYKQSLPGAGYGISLCSVTLVEKTYLAFPSVGKKVTIVDDSLKVIQVLVLTDEVVYADFAQPTGRLAVASGSKVVIFEPKIVGESVTWEQFFVSQQDLPVRCLSWKPGATQLLISEVQTLILVNLVDTPPKQVSDDKLPPISFSEVWRTQLSNPASYCTFSPIGNYFATIGDDDPLVKIWYKYNRSGMRRFLYLPHERRVLKISWRIPSSASNGLRTTSEPNVLLTLAEDFSVRIWQESNSKERLHFGVCAVIDPKKQCMVGWVKNPAELIFESNDFTGKQLHVHERQGLRHSLLPSTSDNSVDWIVTITNDGCAILWKLKGLSNQPRCTVSSSIYIKFQINTFWEFPANLVALGNNTNSTAPNNMHYYTIDTTGSVSLWKCESSGPAKTIASLNATCSGHDKELISIVPHPKSSVVASIDESKKLVLWNYSSPKLLEPPFILNDFATLRQCHCLTWIINTPSNIWFAISTATKASIYRLSGSKPIEILPLIDSEKHAPFSNLYSSPGKEKYEPMIIGISNSGELISSWILKWIENENENLPSVTPLDPISFSNEERIICADSRNDSFWFGVNITLLTGGADGEVRLWSFENSELKQKSHFNLSPGNTPVPVNAIKIGTFGYFATKMGSNINVWQLEELNKLANLYVVNLSPTAFFDWFPLKEGNNVLLLAKGKELSLLQKTDDKLKTGLIVWETTRFQTLNTNASTIAWTSDGSLLCGSSNELLVFTGWLAEGSDYPTLYNWFLSRVLSLPFYHPKLLVDYLMAGQTYRVGTILHQLLEYIEKAKKDNNLDEVPLFSLESFFQEEKSSKEEKKEEDDDPYSFLNTSTSSSFALDDNKSSSFSLMQNTKSIFPPSESQQLTNLLTSFFLPNVSGPDQTLLLAIIDTFTQVQATQGGIDDCGMRFLLSFKLFTFLQRALSPADRPESLTSFDFAWALHSESQSAVIQAVLPPNSTWPIARSLGIGLWLNNPTLLRDVVEKLAKAQFSASKDPHDCFLFYLALGKKPALVALFNAVKNTKVHDFVNQDFSIPKNQTSALKNAYALLSKHRFELAAAFFLLGGQPKDCVNLCLQKLGDYQLALIVARLVEGDDEGPIYRSILKDYVIPLAKENNDKMLGNIASWLCKDYGGSVKTLLPEEVNTQKVIHFDPTTIHFFNFLRSHTMLRNVNLDLDEIDFNLVTKAARFYSHSRISLSSFEHLKNLIKQLADKNKPATPTSSSGGYSFSSMGRFNLTRRNSITQVPTKQIDKTLLYSIAIQTLAQEVCNISRALPKYIKEQPQLLNDNLKFIVTTLKISEDIFRKELFSFCELNNHTGALFLLYWDNKEKQLELLQSTIIHLLSISQTEKFPNLSTTQSSQLFSVAKQLFYILKSEVIEIPDAKQKEAYFAIALVSFIYLWSEKNYKKIQTYLSGEKTIEQLLFSGKSEKQEVDIIVSSGEETDDIQIVVDENVKIYLSNLFQYLVLKKFASIQQFLNDASSPGIQASDVLKYIEVFNRWCDDLQFNLRIVPNAINSLVTSLVNLDYHLFYRFYREWEKYKEDLSFHSLLDFLLGDEFLRITITQIPFKKKISKDASLTSSIDFSRNETIFKDSDLLQSFCMNAVDPSFIAMATTRGIKEIHIDFSHKLEVDDEEDTQSENSLHEDLDHSADGPHSNSPAHFLSTHSTHHALGTHSPAFHSPVSGHSASSSPASNKRVGRNESHDSKSSLFGKSKKTPLAYQLLSETSHHTVVQYLVSHPVDPYYLGGGIDGNISLWQYNAPKDSGMITTFHINSHQNPRVNKIHFNPGGTKFGACDMGGDFGIWRFGNDATAEPFKTFHCNSKRTLDFAFMNSGSVVATAGISLDQRNICIWDTLLPRSLVGSFVCHESGASSLVYSPKHQLLISGGKKGDIVVFDIRQQKELERIKAHSMNVKSLTLDPLEKYIISGSNEGNVRVWELPSFACKTSWDDVHMKQRFVRAPGVFTDAISTFGVMQVKLVNNYLYSCGSDGRLLRVPFDY